MNTEPQYVSTRGLRLIGQGREAEIFECPDGRALKLQRARRRVLLSSYVRAYRRHAAEPIDEARVRRWEIVNLAVRVSDEIPGERPRLLQRLREEFAHGD
jgi:hypothetical protein